MYVWGLQTVASDPNVKAQGEEVVGAVPGLRGVRRWGALGSSVYTGLGDW